MWGPDVLRHARNAAIRAPGRLRQLTIAELALLLQAPVALPLSALALRRYGLRRVQTILGRQRRAAGSLMPAARRDEVERLAWIVKIAAMYGPWPANCLQRSLVLWWYLHRRGYNSELRIGVRRDKATGLLDFHAWIEHDGAVINDPPDVRERYATFERPIAPRDAVFN